MGELRFFLPRADSQQIPTSATFNGETFAVANTIPPAQLAGFALFGDSPYIAPYSFYLGATLFFPFMTHRQNEQLAAQQQQNVAWEKRLAALEAQR